MRVHRFFFALMFVFLTVQNASAQKRTWSDVNGNTSEGTFQRLSNNDRVVLRCDGRIVGLPFWDLMPDDQQAVIDKLKELRQKTDHLQITDVPRDWKDSRGNTARGQFLKVEPDGQIALVINAQKQLFTFENFGPTDQDYIRDFLARDGKQSLVPAKAAAAATQTPVQGTAGPATSARSLLTTPLYNPPSMSGNGSLSPPGGPVTPSGPSFPTTPGSPTSSSLGDSPGFPTPFNVPATDQPVASEPDYQSFPDQTMASVNNTPAISSIPGPADSDLVEIWSCSNCKREFTTDPGSKCPHCGVWFDYIEDADGNRSINFSSRNAGRIVGRLLQLGVVLALGAFGLFKKLSGNR